MSETWLDMTAAAEIMDGDVIGVEAHGRDVAIYSVDGQLYATDNMCSHGHARLCEGFLEGHEIECPLHQGRFDIRNGAPSCAPVLTPIKSYPVKIENDRVLIGV